MRSESEHSEAEKEQKRSSLLRSENEQKKVIRVISYSILGKTDEVYYIRSHVF